MQTLSSYVQGSWVDASGDLATLHDPSTEEAIAQCGTGGIDMAAVLRHAREAGGPALRALSFPERGLLLKALSKAIHEHREELIDLSIRNGGATRGDAKFDLDGATGTLAAYAAFAKGLPARGFLSDGEGIQLGRTARFWGQHVLVPREGVAIHVNAFNFPAWNMCEKLACALLAGVPVVEKPGTPTALIAWRVARIVVESGVLPAGSFQFLCGSAGDLLDHAGPQDVLAFTGGSRTAALLRGHDTLVRHNVHINAEADSLNAAVLSPDVDRDSETYELFLSNVQVDMTQKTGQKCTAVRRILVPRDRVDEVAEDLLGGLARIQVGNPAERDTRMGPVTSASALRDVREGIRALAEVCDVRTGGADAIAEKGFFVAPTLLVAREPEAAVVHTREVFGPVATIVPFDGTAAEAVRLTNLGGGGLVASLYANDRAWTDAVVLGIGPWHGRIWIASDRVASQALPPGMVLPATIHGGPGRAGGGEELGGLRGLAPYLQRVALQGFQGHLERAFGAPAEATAAD